jgi:hypothetical protein
MTTITFKSIEGKETKLVKSHGTYNKKANDGKMKE